MTLDAIQARVLGALIEKEIVTPENYPLSLNALVNACNQRSSREPVMDLNEEQVQQALHRLEDLALASTSRDSRVAKFEHRARTVFNLRRDETAILCLLLLRGPQTPGELRSRSDRMYSFDGTDAVESTLARQFYAKQCALDGWSTRELDRQINAMLFERLALSTDKAGVLALARGGHAPRRPEDLLKDPYLFEFLGLKTDHALSEAELETRLIDHLQEFLMELGRGFCFVARQKRISVGADHFYIDLVFYHRILKCFVLIDLKMEPFKPADAGQMNFYLNWMKDQEGSPDDNPPVGILLCMDRNELYVKYATMGMENLVLAGRFALQLPDPEQLSAAVAEVLRETDSTDPSAARRA